MKPLSKINQEIIDLYNRVEEIEEYDATSDFDTRDGRIVANIKTYSWIDQDDLLDIINPLNLTEAQKQDVLDEFDDERLNNIYYHSCEDFVRGWKDELEDRCHLNDLVTRAHAYNFFLQNKDSDSLREKYKFYFEYYMKEFEAFKKRKKNGYYQYLAYIRKKNKFDYEEARRLDLISPEVWQLGRSGGWLSVCKKSVLEDQRLDEHIGFYEVNRDDNDAVNEALRDAFCSTSASYQEKRRLIGSMKYFIKSWEETFDAVTHYVTQIEKSRAGFKEGVLERLREEVGIFLADYSDAANCTIAMQEDLIKTSLGVTIPLSEFKEAYISFLKKHQTFKPGDKFDFKVRVGNYTTQFAKIGETDTIIKAGCHKFSLNQIQQAIAV